jgi:heptosyltransferase-1
MRVLIVKVSALGDIVHALPVLDYLHKASPGIENDWVVEEPFREVLEGNPLISELHLVRTKVWRKKPFARDTMNEIRSLKSQLQARNYDMAFDIQGNLKSGVICRLSGAKTRFGFTSDRLQERINLFFTTRQIPMRSIDYHITDQYLRLVSVPFGKNFREMELTSNIFTTPEDEAAADILLSTLSDGLVFLFHYGTTWQTKFWSEERWVELAKNILGTFADSTILFSWGNSQEREAVTRIASSIGRGARILNRYPLKGLIALMKKVDLVVGGDTGPVHLAAAVGTPTVSFYRASDGKRSGPRGLQNVTIQSSLHCTACFRTKCDDDARCRDSIKVEAIMKAIEGLLSYP